VHHTLHLGPLALAFVASGAAACVAAFAGWAWRSKGVVRLEYQRFPVGDGGVALGNGGRVFVVLRKADGRDVTRLSLAGLPRGVVVAREDRSSALLANLVGADVASGDPSFDGAVYVKDADPDLVAFLDADARAAILRVVSDGAALKGGTWVVEVPGSDLPQATVNRWVRHLVNASAPWWTRRCSAAEALQTLVRDDPNPRVRAWALCRLARTADADDAAAALIAARACSVVEALSSSEPDRVVAAAISLRVRGESAHLPALREVVARGGEPERSMAERAIAAILERSRPAAEGALSVASDGGDLSRSADAGPTLSVPEQP
jgi:hypothetical protein